MKKAVPKKPAEEPDETDSQSLLILAKQSSNFAISDLGSMFYGYEL